MEKTISRTLAEYASKLSYKKLDKDSIHAAKRFLLDTIGCALGGWDADDCRILSRIAFDQGGNKEATIIGSGKRTNATWASLVNALLVRVHDYNDIYWKQDPSHPSDLIPAALAAGERGKRSGKDLLVGTVLAYEIEMRLCEASEPGIRERGWHHASLTQFVSPLVAGKLLGLSVGELQNAVGIAGSHNFTLGGVVAGKLSMMKNTADPMATQSGVVAAMMAKHGYKGPEAVFEGKEGLFQTMNMVSWNPEKIVRGLDGGFKINECSFKAFPTEYLTHTPISATIQIRNENKIDFSKVKLVLVKSLRRAADILADPSKYKPTSKETADHSLPYCIAAALVEGELTPAQFSEEMLKDPRILSTINKVKVEADPDIEKNFPRLQPAYVEIQLESGETHGKYLEFAKGDPRDPMSDAELEEKFHALATPLLSKKARRRVIDMIWSLEKVEEIRDLMRACRTDK